MLGLPAGQAGPPARTPQIVKILDSIVFEQYGCLSIAFTLGKTQVFTWKTGLALVFIGFPGKPMNPRFSPGIYQVFSTRTKKPGFPLVKNQFFVALGRPGIHLEKTW